VKMIRIVKIANEAQKEHIEVAASKSHCVVSFSKNFTECQVSGNDKQREAFIYAMYTNDATARC
jgi:hypothetical protein